MCNPTSLKPKRSERRGLDGTGEERNGMERIGRERNGRVYKK